MLEFQNYGAFALLLAVPLLYLLKTSGILVPVSFPLTLSDWGGSSFSWHKKIRSFSSACSYVLAAAGYAAAVCALADPVMVHQEKIYTSRGTDILFVLDTSPSMAARDIAGLTRIDAAKQSIRALTAQDTGASFGLVTMASEAAVSVPPTTDHAAFLKTLDSVAVGMLGDGSAIGTGLSIAVYHLISSSAPVKCIVLITDGENNAGPIHPDTAAEIARKNGILVYTLAVGTQGSVPLEYTDPKTGKIYSGYLESNFSSASLRALAEKAGGRAFEIQTIESLSSALAAIEQQVKTGQTYYYRATTEQYYPQFLTAALTLFSLAWIIRRLFLQEIV